MVFRRRSAANPCHSEATAWKVELNLSLDFLPIQQRNFQNPETLPLEVA